MALNYFELISWFTVLSFLALYFLPDYRFYLIIFLAFAFGFWLSWSELHTVEVVVLTLIPLFLAIVLLFMSHVLFNVLAPAALFNDALSATGMGTLVLFGLVTLIGIPLSFLAKHVRYLLFPILEA
jgi:hypothetical protein